MLFRQAKLFSVSVCTCFGILSNQKNKRKNKNAKIALKIVKFYCEMSKARISKRLAARVLNETFPFSCANRLTHSAARVSRVPFLFFMFTKVLKLFFPHCPFVFVRGLKELQIRLQALRIGLFILRQLRETTEC